MPRYFVHVNINPDRKHIKLHAETHEACGHIFKHVKVGGIYEGTSDIEKLDRNTFKIAQRDNGYWLIVWAQNSIDVLRNPHVRTAAHELGEQCTPCDNCS